MAQPGLALSTTELIERYSIAPDKLNELRKYDSYSGSVRIRPASDLTDFEKSLKKVNSLKVGFAYIGKGLTAVSLK